MSNKPEMMGDKFRYRVAGPKGYLNILNFFRSNLVEVRFKRKNFRKAKTTGHRRPTRRMLCTSNWDFISNPTVAQKLNFESPKGPSKGMQWYSKRNLVITWDILEQNWRIINLKDLTIIAALPLNNEENYGKFLTLYDNFLEPITKERDPLGNRRRRYSDK